mmetsp:Transcript_20043/g.37696  ORF Transcript_20043/g.37696 Transcript_20043/m.37696 type:complete len:106 (-) Transcript_20043:844-1161(-)
MKEKLALGRVGIQLHQRGPEIFLPRRIRAKAGVEDGGNIAKELKAISIFGFSMLGGWPEQPGCMPKASCGTFVMSSKCFATNFGSPNPPALYNPAIRAPSRRSAR